MSKTVVTGLCRLSYVHLFEAFGNEGQEKKYSVSLLIPKSDEAQLNKINAAIAEVKKEYVASHGGKLPAKFKMPLNDGDVEKPEDPAYAEMWYLNATCKQKPCVVDRELNPVLTPEDVYSGCYGRASVTFFAFEVNGNRGIGCGLNNVQKWKEGEPLGNVRRPEDDFSEPLDGDDDLL